NMVTVTAPGGSPVVSAKDETQIDPVPVKDPKATCTQIYGAPFEGKMITKTFVIEDGSPHVLGGLALVDTLPAGLTLLSATASQGTITTAANTVTWNGFVPANGSVIVEITATVDLGTLGTTI